MVGSRLVDTTNPLVTSWSRTALLCPFRFAPGPSSKSQRTAISRSERSSAPTLILFDTVSSVILKHSVGPLLLHASQSKTYACPASGGKLRTNPAIYRNAHMRAANHASRSSHGQWQWPVAPLSID